MTLQNIHQILSDARKTRGISQKELADALNVEQATISLYENGKRGIPLDLLDDWLAILGMKVIIESEDRIPLKSNDEQKHDLELFNQLKTRRNYLIAELRALQAEHLMKAAENIYTETGSRFWLYSYPGSYEVGLVEARTDHPLQEQIAVEYTRTAAFVYKFCSASNGQKSDQEWLGVIHPYFKEDDFLLYGQIWDKEALEERQVTLLQVDAKHPEGHALLCTGGFSAGPLLSIEQNHLMVAELIDQLFENPDFKKLVEGLNHVEERLTEIQLNNALGNGAMNPAFSRWTDKDQASTSIPLNREERTWEWVEEGAEWADDFDAGEVRIMTGSPIPKHARVLYSDEGVREIGLIGDQNPAVFMRNPLKAELLYRVEVPIEDLNEKELQRYEHILAFAQAQNQDNQD